MKKRYCNECQKEVKVYEETVNDYDRKHTGDEVITCGICAYVIAILDFQ